MSAQAQPIKLLAPAAMLQMIQGFWISRAICVVAELGIPDLLTGRWFGLMAEGHFVDSDIAEAPPISHEMAIAAPMQYAIGYTLGIVYLLVISVLGLSRRGLIKAIGFGLCMNLLPWLLMFPAIGYGWFGTHGPPGTRLFLSSVVTHCIYGIGLWLAASILS